MSGQARRPENGDRRGGDHRQGYSRPKARHNADTNPRLGQRPFLSLTAIIGSGPLFVMPRRGVEAVRRRPAGCGALGVVAVSTGLCFCSPVVIDPVGRVAGRVVIAHPWDRGARCRRCGPRRSRAARYRRLISISSISVSIRARSSSILCSTCQRWRCHRINVRVDWIQRREAESDHHV